MDVMRESRSFDHKSLMVATGAPMPSSGIVMLG
jgi:hypothetical protein